MEFQHLLELPTVKLAKLAQRCRSLPYKRQQRRCIHMVRQTVCCVKPNLDFFSENTAGGTKQIEQIIFVGNSPQFDTNFAGVSIRTTQENPKLRN